MHTAALVDGHRTTDRRIAGLVDDEGRVVVTKDRHFRDGHLLARSPERLPLVSTCNITDAALLSLARRISPPSTMRSTRPTSSS